MLSLTLVPCAASIEEIIAMKIDVISIDGRKKDFWDLHELKDEFTIDEMFALHRKKHEYIHNRDLIKTNFTKFKNEDEDFDQIVCVIKLGK